MISTDALAEAYHADRDPQHQDPDLFDEEKWLEGCSNLFENIDYCIDLADVLLDTNHSRNILNARTALKDALRYVEGEL